MLCLPFGSLRADDAQAAPAFLPADALKNMTVEELLEQPVMSVSREPEAWGQAASDVFLIQGQAAESTGATTLPELLRLAPSLFVAQASSSEWAINARGFVRSDAFSNKLLVMIDGRTVYSPLFSNVFWDATSVFLPDLKQIEVISGPAGATWGANAVNGVINIETKSAFETLGGLAFVDSGSQETDRGIRYGLRLGNEGALRFYYQSSQTDASLSNTGTDDGFDSWKASGGGFRADWNGPDTTKFTVSGDFFQGKYGNGALADTENDTANLLTRWSRDLSPDSQLWVRLYYDYTKRDSEDDITEDTRTTDLEFQNTLKLAGNQKLLWGADYRMMSDNITHTVGFVILPPHLLFNLGSVFAEHQVGFLDDALRLTTGLRLEHNYFSGWEYQPSVRLAFVRPRDTFWAAISRATRIPSRLETGFNAPEAPPYYVVGGANVVAETVQAYELGWRSQPAKDFALTTTLYYNDYDHLRSVEPTTPATFANGVRGRSYGLELFADWNVTPWWRLRVGGFRMNQETWLAPGGNDIEHALGESSFPKDQVELRNSFRPGKSVIIWTSLRHVAAVPTYESQVIGSVPAYTELDVHLGWDARPDLELGLTGRNLLHASHPELGSLEEQRDIQRSVQADVHFRF